MSKIRKYEEYKIVITYDNGDKEEINYKGINTSNYSEMLRLYAEVKEKYSDKSVVIDFVGVSSSGELNIFWTKKIENKDNSQKEDISSCEKDSIELIEEIYEKLKLLNKRKELVRLKQGTLDKQQDIELHRIENFDGSNLTEEQEINEKLRIFDSIKYYRNQRRRVKLEVEALETFYKLKGIEGVGSKIKNILQLYNNKNNKQYEYLTDEKAKQLKIMERFKYKTEKERINLVSQNLNKYDKVYYENGEVICYNKAN